ncbi:hypothetical protein EXIGLDRAFT_175223 [Exidia glandulosa HHB12029]|uniref:Uncharacterized protein n=1 Tax=Exidia glandulosa HHB12029 TaxID=1314781 RepID=A0A165F5K8_EXIGL|nr:hypothetical protein EXIGLDRAFT_175223 [Exidia glandulosa HHB12029]
MLCSKLVTDKTLARPPREIRDMVVEWGGFDSRSARVEEVQATGRVTRIRRRRVWSPSAPITSMPPTRLDRQLQQQGDTRVSLVKRSSSSREHHRKHKRRRRRTRKYSLAVDAVVSVLCVCDPPPVRVFLAPLISIYPAFIAFFPPSRQRKKSTYWHTYLVQSPFHSQGLSSSWHAYPLSQTDLVSTRVDRSNIAESKRELAVAWQGSSAASWDTFNLGAPLRSQQLWTLNVIVMTE